jgi:hypothetical protein
MNTTVQDPGELVEEVKANIKKAIDEAAVVTRQMPVRPWPDTTTQLEEMVITTDQLLIVVPEEVWQYVLIEIPPVLDQLVGKAMAAEERAQSEWERRRVIEDRLAISEEKTNGWRTMAEDLNGVLWSARSTVAEARVIELEEALKFYADKDNWNPEPRVLEAGVSTNDRGGIARAVLTSGGK